MLMYEAFSGAKPRRRLRMATFGLVVLALASLGAAVPTIARGKQETTSALVEVLSSGRRGKELKSIVEHTQARLLFSKDFSERIAIGSEEIAKVEKVVSKREVLLSAVKVGTTSLMVWFADGTVEQYMFSVTRDLSVLESALREISPTIQVEIAPDRDAVVLVGTVPTKELYDAAQKAASDYLNAGSQDRRAREEDAAKKGSDAPGTLTARGHVINRLKITTSGTPLEEIIRHAAEILGAKDAKVTRIVHGDRADDQYDQFVLYGSVGDRGIRDEILSKADNIVRRFDPDPRSAEKVTVQEKVTITEYAHAPFRIHDRMVVVAPTTEGGERSRKPVLVERMQDALAAIGCDSSGVRVEVVEGVGDAGVLVLSGTVGDQSCLTRILSIASRLVGGGSADMNIRVLADESGALYQQGTNASNQFGGGVGDLFSGATSGGRSSGSGFAQLLGNRIDANIARAKAIELAGGRIVSFIRVEDIPQVRIDIKLYEVNRNALLSWKPNLKLGLSDFDQNGVNPNNFVNDPTTGQPITNADGEVVLSSDGTDARGLLSFLGGTLTGNLQLSGEHARVDALLQLLEKEGIARSLSNPSLTVLSGEQAFFGVGGTVPIQQQIVTSFGNGSNLGQSTSGLLNATVERDFGIRLAVRPLIDEDGFITLDVVPTVSNPDADLTALVRSSTGTNPQTVAFQERSMRTSARLRDGQVLLLGGLMDHSRIDDASKTPFLHKIPLLGWLFKDFSYTDGDRELVIVVNPVIVRDAPKRRSMWAFPEASEYLPKMKPAVAPKPVPSSKQEVR